jgi:maltose alpha-D-glucosyltransferase/alpha-amylase
MKEVRAAHVAAEHAATEHGASDADTDALWYKDAIIYQVHVRAYADSDADGIGDFEGLTSRLDYVHELGATAIWLLPFYPSPLRDDGYDIADYTDVNSAYGDMRAFRRFLREAHRRGVRVITELVMNHTSDAHPWFRRARSAPPQSRWRNFYVWSDDPGRFSEARVIFQDFESSNWTWDNEAQAYYWHRFYSHQPDLNFDNPEVRRAMMRALDFWLEAGVDGVRLDAVPYLFERDGTNCENLPETHGFLRELREHVDARFANRMLLAEANQWPEDAVAYFGNGDECHMAFHFPVMPRIFMALQMEHRLPIIDILEQTPAIPANAQWAMFLRNHDELTLEMVTDEERDYMYRRYADDPRMRVNLGIRRRLAPLLQNDRRKIELLNGLLFSLPGTPIVYYGDEIGMGDNVYLGDRDSVRTPMQWNGDRNAGFSRANPQQLYLPVVIDPEYHYEALNVEAQQRNPSSLWWWMRRLVALRKMHPVLARGDIAFLDPDNPKVLAFLRSSPATGSQPGETVLVVANLSRHAQQVELDLRRFDGARPIELFGHTTFSTVTQRPYALTLAPHAFHWFQLEIVPEPVVQEKKPTIAARGDLEVALRGVMRRQLTDAVLSYVAQQRWFAGKARRVQDASIADVITIEERRRPIGYLLLLHLEYTEGEPEVYSLPVVVTEAAGSRPGSDGDEVAPRREDVLVTLDAARGIVLRDGSSDPQLTAALFELVRRGGTETGEVGRLVGVPARALRGLARGDAMPRGAARPGIVRTIGAEQSNTSVLVGERVLMKLLRKIEAGTHPEVELGRQLSEIARLPYVAPFGGVLEYERPRARRMTVASLTGYVPNDGDAWSRTLDELGRFYEQAAAEGLDGPPASAWPRHPLTRGLAGSVAIEVVSIVAESLEHAGHIGVRTAQLHHALSSGNDPSFTPLPFTRLYQRSLYQSLRSDTRSTLRLLAKRLGELDRATADIAASVLDREATMIDRFSRLTRETLEVSRIRIHGDLHLGQVLVAGTDVVFIDFEGEPARPLGERLIKRTAFRDVAGMLRSYDYAAKLALEEAAGRGITSDESRHTLEAWGRLWVEWVGRAFVDGYLTEAAGASFVPKADWGLELLLEVSLLQKAVYELGYELANRPAWVHIPVRALDEYIASLQHQNVG